MNSAFEFQVEELGSAAAAALAAAPGGEVIAVFRRSFYVKGAGGGLVCIGPPGIGAGPLNAICELPEGLDWEASGLHAGDSVSIAEENLTVGGRFSFGLKNMARWHPPLPAFCKKPELEEGLRALAGNGADRFPEEGLGRLIPWLLNGRAVATGAENPFLKAGMEGASALYDWMCGAGGDGGAPPPEAATALIGLGPGLTPSGDDLIGGAMIALRALGREDMAKRLADWALPLAEVRTGEISCAHLRCAARGEGAAALHAALGWLMAPAGEVELELEAALDRIGAIGHTSGWDALAGATLACAAWAAWV
ncbi:MAG: DUF2877 domain-containing protein [bacterium]|nr:DUF2877 domain-containing protein [bacterium]